MSGSRYVHDRETHNQRAARQVVPWLLKRFAVRTVIDVGCGLGTWLAVFAAHGCEILGLEGEQVSDELLAIPRDKLRVVDLERSVTAPRRYDLALCLEVAEHLSAEAGQELVRMLCSTSDVVLFSAAVPGQGGDNHLNEQWPAYWQHAFEKQGFAVEDRVRWAFWCNDEVDWWYRQNMFIARRGERTGQLLVPVVHPQLLQKKERIIGSFYAGEIGLRTATIVALRSFLHAARKLGGAIFGYRR